MRRALSGPSNNLKNVGVLLLGPPVLPPLEWSDKRPLLHLIAFLPFLDQLGKSPEIGYFVTKNHFELLPRAHASASSARGTLRRSLAVLAKKGKGQAE
jgi:hypothetical protein